MERYDLWPRMQECMRGLGAVYSPALEGAAQELGLPVHDWFLLLPAYTFEPEPVTAEKLNVHNPYTSPTSYEARLSGLAERRMLEKTTAGYRLLAAGRKAVLHGFETACARMAERDPLLRQELERLAGLLLRLVESSLESPDPPGKWSIRLSRRTDFGHDAHPVVRIDQYLADLAAYRNDAHLAAWQPYGVSGQAWEALAMLCRHQPLTLDDLAKKLERRGFSRPEWGEALQDLAHRGWAAEVNGQYRPTPHGWEVRQEAEELTDRYFYTPWAYLTEPELEELDRLLTALADGLKTVEAD